MNALFPILVTLPGIVILVKPLHSLNAPISILVTLSDIVTLVKLLHLENPYSLIFNTPFDIIILVILVLYSFHSLPKRPISPVPDIFSVPLLYMVAVTLSLFDFEISPVFSTVSSSFASYRLVILCLDTVLGLKFELYSNWSVVLFIAYSFGIVKNITNIDIRSVTFVFIFYSFIYILSLLLLHATSIKSICIFFHFYHHLKVALRMVILHVLLNLYYIFLTYCLYLQIVIGIGGIYFVYILYVRSVF